MVSGQPPGQLHEGRNYPSPVQKILALGYYDGPTEGALLSAPDRVYRFRLLAWDEETQDLRFFALAPLPPPAFERLAGVFARHETPRWPVWVASGQGGPQRAVEAILGQAGPIEW